LAALREKTRLFSSQINFFASFFSSSQSLEVGAEVFLCKTKWYSDVICVGKQQTAAASANFTVLVL
jgi:hypothetical protein